MKVHYISILLFALPLNILITLCHVYNQRNHKCTTPHYTPNNKPTKSHRTLCECELYAPSNYDNDPQMKKIMEIFNKQTQERLHEYDDRMKTTRQKCKDRCDKEIEKIILKDKMEKELTEKLSTLQTDIQSDAIPTCICKKSVADKVEKGCLRCGYGLGTVAPTVGLIGSVAVRVWKTKALEAAIAAALEEGATKIAAAGIKAGQVAGKNALIEGLYALNIEELRIGSWEQFIDPVDYTKVSGITNIIFEKKNQMCGWTYELGKDTCHRIGTSLGTTVENGPRGPPDIIAITEKVNEIVAQAKGPAKAAAKTAEKGVAAQITEDETAAINTIFMSKQTAIIASIVAIVVIVLIMVIIYLILRYRRKKKMKKKLQYIKLLEE